MASVNNLLELVNCTIRFSTPEGHYEGIVKEVFPAAEIVIVGKLILLPDIRMGALNFRCCEMANLKVINRPDLPKEKSIEKQDVLPVYPKTATEKLFDLDGSSDIEEDDTLNLQAEYKMKLVPHLSKFVPKDFAIIDAFNKDFNLAIKHIKRQDTIGVSLEGVQINRSGILTWLCISSPCCNFLFDILALGEQAFKKGLKSILENARIVKIFHDCRLPSDCLYHKYGIRLINVFDTQVADFIVMMQMVEKEKIDSRVNTLDACLNYYLEVPDDHLYGVANFDNIQDSVNFHALRPLKHDIQDVLIKNVMYLHLLKRELELALQTPLRRATDVYLNSLQKLKEKELLVMPHKPDELPPDIHLEGIQIFRYRDFEYLCSTAASGPPYRELRNPIKNYLNYRAEYKNGQREDIESIVNKHASQSSSGSSSKINGEANVDFCNVNQKSACGFKSDAKQSSGCSSESDRENFDEMNHSATYQAVKTKSNNSGVKSDGFQLSDYAKSKNPIVRGLADLLFKYKNNPDTGKTVDNSSQSSENNSAEIINVKNKPVTRDSPNTVELSNLKSTSNPPCNNMSKATSSQMYGPSTIEKKIPKEILEHISEMRSRKLPNTASTSCEHSANDSIITTKSLSKDVEANINGVSPKTEPVQINNSVIDTDISASELKQVEARVKARAAQLRNRKTVSSTGDTASTSDYSNRNIQGKLIKETGTFSKKQDCLTEEVTIYHSVTLDKPSQFVVKVNHQRTRLADLYEKAGDRSLLWTREDTDDWPMLSCSQPDNCKDSDDIWAAVREGLPCKMDEKLQSRLIPAGMSGY